VQEAPRVPTGYVAHGNEQHALSLTRLEDGDDVRVVDGRGRPGFRDEPLPEAVVRGERRGQDLQGNQAPEAVVTRPEDDRHPALADAVI
jgi:hypothetical protein